MVGGIARGHRSCVLVEHANQFTRSVDLLGAVCSSLQAGRQAAARLSRHVDTPAPILKGQQSMQKCICRR
jgi:hypothetical protein